MDNNLSSIIEKALAACNAAQSLEELDNIRVHYLGKKGILTQLIKTLSSIPDHDKAAFGKEINIAKDKLLQVILNKQNNFNTQSLNQKKLQDQLDVTLPGRGTDLGTLHPVTLCKRRIERFFLRLGFELVSGPEIENDYYNFEALNIPKLHPARDMHDTFYFNKNSLLRTHTSPVQVRKMEQTKPPVKIITCGKVFRCDYDATHTPMFHQVEALYIDKGVNFGNLKSILIDFLQYFFEKKMEFRFRPGYFQFTEPSAEIDMQCIKCDGKGCRLCKHSGWIEILGCGMVHPNVLRYGNIDSEIYTGWAFGGGIDRMAMFRYGIDDLRVMFENDVEFLKQFTWD